MTVGVPALAPRRLRFLCVCDGGNVRSAALAFVLKHRHGHEAVPVGRLFAGPETMRTFCAWADVVVVMQPHMAESVPAEHRGKVRCVDVGPDRFGVYVHPELLPMAAAGAEWLTAGDGRTA